MPFVSLGLRIFALAAVMTSMAQLWGQENQAPMAGISMPSEVEQGQTVVLDGTPSRDADGDKLDYLWEWSGHGHKPGRFEEIPDAAGKARFVAKEAGEYGVQLTVSDGRAQSQPLQVVVKVVKARSAPTPALTPPAERTPATNGHVQDGEPTARPAFKPLAMSELPELKKEWEEKVTKTGKVNIHGLLSTINYEEFKAPELKDKLEVRVQPEGFAGELKVNLVTQSGKAPLAVVLLGFYGERDSKLAKTWMTYLQAAGCHAMVFDSVFHKNFNAASGHGVPGNMPEEAKAIAKVVDAVMDWRGEKGERAPLRGNVSSVRVLGTSYGGLLALHLQRCPQAKTWPLDRNLVLSSPVSMRTSARLVDKFYRIDRTRFEPSLLRLMGGYRPDSYPPSDKDESLMRAGIGYDFYDSLEDVLGQVEAQYMPGLFAKYKEAEEKSGWKARYAQAEREMKARHDREMVAFEAQHGALKNDEKRKDEYKELKKKIEHRQKVESNDLKKRLSEKDGWTFQDFVEQLAAPYWKKSVDLVWAQGELSTLLQDAPETVQVILAADDPLNDPAEVQILQARWHNPKVTILPHGGHLGYCGTEWVQALVKKYFAP